MFWVGGGLRSARAQRKDARGGGLVGGGGRAGGRGVFGGLMIDTRCCHG